MIPGNERRHWFIPLVAGAEMNRLKPPPIVYFTSWTYPALPEDDIGLLAPPNDVIKMQGVIPLDTASLAVPLQTLYVSPKPFSGLYTVPPEPAALGASLLYMTTSPPPAKPKIITMVPEAVSMGASLRVITLSPRAIVYPIPVESIYTAASLIGVTRS